MGDGVGTARILIEVFVRVLRPRPNQLDVNIFVGVSAECRVV